MNLKGIWLCALYFMLWSVSLNAQTRVLKGVIKDTHSDETIPFASIQFKGSGFGKLSDSSGHFTIVLNRWLSDTLIVSYAGFEEKRIGIDTSLLEIDLVIAMERGRPAGEVIVRTKFNRGLYLWKKIVKNKPVNNRARFSNFSYELYNKLEIDINKVNKEKLQKGFLPPKPFKFILENIDSTSEDEPILPVYLTEAISDYYYQSSPRRTKEVIKANKTIGIKNESFSRFLGGMYQNINVYTNFIPVFDLEFVSPISDNGDNYYDYRVPDTQYIAGRRYFHLVFYPKRKGENTFQGDAWIADSSFAVQKMNLRLSPTANVNFVEKLSMVQEFRQINDSTWFLAKDKFIVDFSLLGKRSINFIGRKTTTYRDIKVNTAEVSAFLDGEQLREAIVINQGASDRPDEYWQDNRHEELNTNEQKIYSTVDTLLKMPAFQRWKERLYFLGTGYKNIGNFEIGPWFNWVTGNIYEGFRTRFDVGTNTKFSRKLYLHGYLAYGFKDKGLKGMAEAKYMFSRNPRSYLHVIYKDDIDYGQTYYDEIGYDNIFALAIRKSQVPIKLIRIHEFEVNYLKEWKNGFSVKGTVHRQVFNPLINLPPKENFITSSGEVFNTFEATMKLRFAYLERYLETSFNRTTFGSDYPIGEIRFTKAIPGVLNSAYNYTKLSLNVSDWADIPPFGNIYWSIFAGRTFGTAPYMFLNIAPGNEIYYYNKYAFNLMNRYEYINDRYAGFIFEHNIGNGIFRLLQPLRFLKFRQFWNVKMLAGSLSAENKALNFVNGHPFISLDGKPYMEIGTGIDNILKFFRVDLVWRLLPQPLPKQDYQRFGVFGSFRIGF